MTNVGIAQLPGFQDSLWLLLENERYAMLDVAMMFGVTRERIHQLAMRCGAIRAKEPRGLNAIRLWDDDLNRFIPVGRVQLARRRAVECQLARVQQLAKQRSEHGKWLVQRMQALAQELGRVPTSVEVAQLVADRTGNKPNNPAIRNFLASSRSRYKDVTAELYAAAGMTVRPRGRKGHITRGITDDSR